MRNKRNFKQENGITLVALIITIIILVILASVAITTVYNTGIIRFVTEGVANYSEAGVNENRIMNGTMSYVSSVVADIYSIMGVEGENGEGGEVTLITLNKTEASMYTGETLQLMTNVTLDDAKNKNVVWSSSEEAIATVDEDGLVTAVSDGEVVVTAKITDGIDLEATCKITVNLIRNLADLENFRDRVNTGQTFEGKAVRLMADIDLSSKYNETNGNSWTPIGNYGTDTTHIFKGKFEGDNHTIKNLYINTTEGYQGLFGYNSGTIRDIRVEGKITGSGDYTGGICGWSISSISNCSSKVTIKTNSSRVGGIAGYSSGTLTRCINEGDVNGTSRVGGICGSAGAYLISECGNIGTIEAFGGVRWNSWNGRNYNFLFLL